MSTPTPIPTPVPGPTPPSGPTPQPIRSAPPPDVQGISATIIAADNSVTPKTIVGITVTELTPVVAAGVRLAQYVLIIVAGSIFLLLAYLITMEIVIGSGISDTYKPILNPSRLGSEFYTLGRLEQVSLTFSEVENDNSYQPTKAEADNAAEISGMLSQLPSITATQENDLKACIPIPKKGGATKDKFDRCKTIIDDVRQAALEAAAGATNAQVAAQEADKLNEHRQSMHTFWIQTAQLILLNLLLPLLTALFGYVFGTQQASGRSST